MGELVYCNFNNFGRSYAKIHGHFSLFVCCFGFLANVCNICVLTRPEMRTPTNLILTGLAVADLLVILDYIPLSYYVIDSKIRYVRHYSYEWAIVVKFHAIFSQIFHFSACCLTVMLATWRYLTIRHLNTARIWCECKRTAYIVLAIFLFSTLVCSPLFISYTISSQNETCNEEGKILWAEDLVNYTGYARNETTYITIYKSEGHNKLCFWIYSVLIKLLPCILLTFLTVRIVIVLYETKYRRKVLVNPDMHLHTIKSGNALKKKSRRDKQADRTSTMLIAVLFLFLLTEFPLAILGFLSAINGREFMEQCYVALGKQSNNISLYCILSRVL